MKPWRNATSWPVPALNIAEDELLLDPFESGFNPLNHFRFGAQGTIVPRDGDERADVTIITLALDRPSLCEARADEHIKIDTDAPAVIRALGNAKLDGDDKKFLRRIANHCAWSSPHAAFYRVALMRELRERNVFWADLRNAWDLLSLAPDVQKPPDDAWID